LPVDCQITLSASSQRTVSDRVIREFTDDQRQWLDNVTAPTMTIPPVRVISGWL
jgi:hypothetical protein